MKKITTIIFILLALVGIAAARVGETNKYLNQEEWLVKEQICAMEYYAGVYSGEMAQSVENDIKQVRERYEADCEYAKAHFYLTYNAEPLPSYSYSMPTGFLTAE